MTEQDLIDFEDGIVELFNAGKLPYPIHFSGGNETQLIEIFKDIEPEDWVFSTWRSHYHALLKGMPPSVLREKIIAGQSMHIMDRNLGFFSSSIVGGTCSIAAGVAFSIKRRYRTNHVWIFIGDAALDEGSSYEAIRYVDSLNLPCTFIVEDNGLSVDTPKLSRFAKDFVWPACVVRYPYDRVWPHCQTGKFVKEYM
jgi:TPP-dependent pyruvate/acetoin dehydrogenase alpha subunit